MRQTGRAASIIMRRVDRAVGDVRRGGLVAVTGDGTATLVQAAELASRETLEEMVRLAGASPALALAAPRALALGFRPRGEGPALAALEPGIEAAGVRFLADPTAAPALTPRLASLEPRPAERPVAAAAVELVKLAELLPAALVARLAAVPQARIAAWAAEHDLLVVEAAAVLDHRRRAAQALRKVSEARVPLLGAEDARLVAFRPAHGGVEQLAVVIGDVSGPDPVLCRLHSECFTGDLLGSLRCDCGEQLRGAIRRMGAEGGGVLLYLAHEGRGIGLVNKLRAYQLQDRGLDTVDANQHLGFASDERTWMAAATMLHQLGIRRVRLLTNNPDKVQALAQQGIEVTERVAHAFRPNEHNRGYLRTKVVRSGHDIRLDAEDPPLRASRAG